MLFIRFYEIIVNYKCNFHDLLLSLLLLLLLLSLLSLLLLLLSSLIYPYFELDIQ